MATIRKNWFSLTVGELKALLKDIDNSVTLEWYDEKGVGVDSIELEITTYDHISEASTVCLNIVTYEGY